MEVAEYFFYPQLIFGRGLLLVEQNSHDKPPWPANHSLQINIDSKALYFIYKPPWPFTCKYLENIIPIEVCEPILQAAVKCRPRRLFPVTYRRQETWNQKDSYIVEDALDEVQYKTSYLFTGDSSGLRLRKIHLQWTSGFTWKFRHEPQGSLGF